MTRARAVALALVNWKGVFYERYELDPHVTALEGANGSGKTTVMIAAYVVLLPDMTRLRFTNMGESGATGGDRGIWGRLGEPGRPSYAAMEIAIPGGESIVAVVHIERKGEPSVELTPFLVAGLPGGTKLRDVLLVRDGEDDAVPEMSQLREAVARLGGRVEAFASAKDYFAALFDRGVLPLRLGTDEERNKYNDMLRTSMSGGISRALTTDLRSFVLREETGLGDALARMRDNVDACHRTRVEVRESARLEREIHGVYEAGQAMFAAALAAVRAHAEERARAVAEARNAAAAAASPVTSLDEAIAEAMLRRETHWVRLPELRAALDAASDRAARAARAEKLGSRRAELDRELAAAASKAAACRAAADAGEGAREARKRERDAAREAYERAAAGVSDLESGLEELVRSAHERRRVRRRLAEAREALGDPALDGAHLDAALADARARLTELDGERARLDRDAQTAAIRAREHAHAAEALARIVSARGAAPERAPASDVPQAHMHERARAELARLAELEALLSRIPELAGEHDHAARLAGRQATARKRAAELGLPPADEGPAAAAARELAVAEAALREAEETARSERALAEAARLSGERAGLRAAELDRAMARHRFVLPIAERVEAALGLPARSHEDLERVRMRLSAEREAARDGFLSHEGRRERWLREAAELESPSHVHPDLARLCQEVNGELLATRFDDLEGDEAARMEAALGPFAEALVVDDVDAAVRKLADAPRELASVWLVAAGSSFGELGEPERAKALDTDDMVVPHAHGVRLTRIPAAPTLGSRARARKAAELRKKAEEEAAAIESALATRSALDALARDLDRLFAESSALEAGAEAACEAERARATSAAAEQRAHEDSARQATTRAGSARGRVEALRALFPDANLLEPPDYAARKADLGAQLQRAREARQELSRVEDARRALSRLLDALRTPPAADGGAAAAAARDAHDRSREALYRACEALEDVLANRHALAHGPTFEDNEPALVERETVVSALKGQLARTREVMQAAETASLAAEAASESLARASQKADGEVAAIESLRARVVEELAGEDVSEAPEAARAWAARTASEARAELAAHEQEERRLATEIAKLRERRVHAAQSRNATEERLALEGRRAGPAAAEWETLSQEAERAGVLEEALGTRTRTRFDSGHPSERSAALHSEVQSRAEVLLERLGAARGGSECAAVVSSAKSALAPLAGEAAHAPGASRASLDAWLAVREWVRHRLPAELGETATAAHALGGLREKLDRLEQHLARQEADLRGVSGDVARGIDVQLRRAQNQVRQLNRHLEGIAFGSIGGIRVKAERIDRMDQVLRALREGAVQELLFQPSMPIEEALDEVFRRYAGGRTGGRRLLDYREYIELTVEIRRKSAGDWETAAATRLSTGEAIGVGSALIMVILGEWEHRANLLRRKRAGGSLRFLLLDEANRLSQDNLGVLFDLCRTLDVQLLIAAPEVARAEGNTTFRLVRRVSEEGREEVLVTGRRVARAS
jgi:chromosome partition protein MukB